VLAEYLMHRASVNEAQGKMDTSCMDYKLILEADPNFTKRYNEKVVKCESMGMTPEAN